MTDLLTNDALVAIALGIIGAVVFSLIGLVSGTDETATIAPLTLLVILLGAPPAGVFTFFLAGAVAKHMVEAGEPATTDVHRHRRLERRRFDIHSDHVTGNRHVGPGQDHIIRLENPEIRKCVGRCNA